MTIGQRSFEDGCPPGGYDPRLDATFNVVGQIREKIVNLPESSQRKVLGENARRFYGLSA